MKQWTKTIVLAMCVVSVLGLQTVSAEEKAVKAEPLGIAVNKGLPVEDRDLKPFNWSVGTRVWVLLTAQEKNIIDFDEDASKITKWADQKGNDMLKKPKFGDTIYGQQRFSKDGKHCAVRLTSPVVPAPDTTRVMLEGKLVVQLAKGQKTALAKDVKLEPKQKFDVGGIQMEVTKAGKPKWQADKFPLEVTIQMTKSDWPKIASLKFLGADGKEIESSRSGRFWFGNVMGVNYRLKQKVDKATIEVATWQNMETVEIPLKIEPTVGM